MAIHLKRGDKGKRGDGAKGDWIVAWQSFLAGQGIYVGNYSPNFGPKSEGATERAQAAWGLKPDGEVGDKTSAEAEHRGFIPPWIPRESALGKAYDASNDPDYPKPSDFDGDGHADLVYLPSKERSKLWGTPEFYNKGGKAYAKGDWVGENIRKMFVPQLKGIDCYGNPSSGNIRFHKLAAAQLLGAMQQIEDDGLLGDLLSYGGSFVFRLIRGSTKTLSNHAYGVAVDFNMKENGLGVQPALLGETGTLRRVVKIFERWGFFWGGWYRNRPDGMHFECVKWIDTVTCTKMVNELSVNEHILPWLKDVA